MSPLFETVVDLSDGAEILARRPYGVIELVEGQFRQVRLRPFAKFISVPEISLLGGWHHRRRPGDLVRLYYNQPWRFRNFLVLKYIVSARQTTMKTFCRALDVLDEIARLKRSDALLCDASNWRLSTKMIARWGWQPHSPSRWHRHYIKRFYGRYPAAPRWLREAPDRSFPRLAVPVEDR